MFEKNFETVFDAFKGSTADEWQQRIISDLKGKDFNSLISKTEDDIEVLPFYTSETTKAFNLSIPKRNNNTWHKAEIIKVDNAQQANETAMLALKNDIDTLIFDLQNKTLSNADIEILTKYFLLDAIQIHIENYGNTDQNILKSKGIHFNSSIHIHQNKSAVSELVDAVSALFNNNTTEIVNIYFPIGQNFFLEIAKLRAFRWLVAQVNTIQQIDKKYLLFAETGNSKRDDDFVENSILRNTTEAISGLLGGCDALIIHPHENSNLGKRIARNIHQLLYYESNFRAIPDVVSGTYYIEYLTYQLAKKTWTKL